MTHVPNEAPAENPFQVLGLDPGAGEEEARQAYLKKVKEYPPDRAPAQFERIRDAYEAVRNPQTRLDMLIDVADPFTPMTELLKDAPQTRRYLGTRPWLEVMKDRSRGSS